MFRLDPNITEKSFYFEKGPVAILKEVCKKL